MDILHSIISGSTFVLVTCVGKYRIRVVGVAKSGDQPASGLFGADVLTSSHGQELNLVSICQFILFYE